MDIVIHSLCFKNEYENSGCSLFKIQRSWISWIDIHNYKGIKMKFTILRGLLAWIVMLSLGAPFWIMYAILSLWRPTVYLIAKWRGLSILSFVRGIDHCFMIDDFYSHPLGALSLASVIDGDIKPEEIINRLSFVFEPGWERLSKIQPVTFMGCCFWSHLPEQLNLSVHVKVHPQQIFGSEALNEVHTSYLQQPFHEKRPLWDILLIKYFPAENQSLQTVLILRVHHVLGDALSVRKIFAMIVDGIQKPASPSLKSSQRYETRLTYILLSPLAEFRLIYDFLLTYSWFSRKKFSRNYRSTTISLPLKQFQMIATDCKKDLNDFSSIAAILWTVSGALRKYLNNSNPKAVGKSFAVPSLPVIKGRHNDIMSVQIGNFWEYAGFHLPIENSSIRQRRAASIKSCQQVTNTEIHKLIPLINSFNENLPIPIHKFWSVKNPPIILSNVPGPVDKQTILGKRILDQTFSFGTLWCNGAVVTAFYSYAGSLKVSFMVNETVIEDSGSDDKRLAQLFLEEVDQVIEHIKGSKN